MTAASNLYAKALEGDDGELCSAQIELMDQVITRAARMLGTWARRQAKRHEDFPFWLQRQEEMNRPAILETVGPAARVCGCDPEDFVSRLFGEFRERLDQCYETMPEQRFADAVDESMTEYETEFVNVVLEDVLASAQFKSRNVLPHLIIGLAHRDFGEAVARVVLDAAVKARLADFRAGGNGGVSVNEVTALLLDMSRDIGDYFRDRNRAIAEYEKWVLRFLPPSRMAEYREYQKRFLQAHRSALAETN